MSRTDFGTLPRAKVGKHRSTAADAADDVKRRDAVYREGGLAASRERLASWMIERSFATGHGDTFEDLLGELSWQIEELRNGR